MYHDYYDIIHQDYDYHLDLAIVENCISTYNLPSNNLLEVGCGTGKHTALLSKLFQKISAFDSDIQMIQRAKEYIDNLTLKNIQFFCGSALELRKFKLPPFDVSCAFFNVINYVLDFDALTQLFTSVAYSITSSGVWIFDCLDSQREYEPKASFDFLYEMNDQKYRRKVQSEYTLANQILHVHESYSGLFNQSICVHEQIYKLWDLDLIEKAACLAGLRTVVLSKKAEMNPAYRKKNQILFIMKKG